MTVRVTREAEPQIELYGAYSGELVGGGKRTLTFTPTGTYLTMVVKNSLSKVQVEQGGFKTSYIPTTGAAATRAADIASIPTSAFGYNSGAGTVVVEASIFDSDSGFSTAVYLGESSSDYVSLYTQYGSYYRVTSKGGNVTSGNILLNTGGDISDVSKVAASWKNNKGFDAARDGTLGSGYSNFEPLILRPTNLHVGSRYGALSYLNGHIKSIQYYPRRLTNAQLQELTT